MGTKRTRQLVGKWKDMVELHTRIPATQYREMCRHLDAYDGMQMSTAISEAIQMWNYHQRQTSKDLQHEVV